MDYFLGSLDTGIYGIMRRVTIFLGVVPMEK